MALAATGQEIARYKAGWCEIIAYTVHVSMQTAPSINSSPGKEKETLITNHRETKMP